MKFKLGQKVRFWYNGNNIRTTTHLADDLQIIGIVVALDLNPKATLPYFVKIPGHFTSFSFPKDWKQSISKKRSDLKDDDHCYWMNELGLEKLCLSCEIKK